MRKGDVKVTLENFGVTMAWYIRFLQKILHARRVVSTDREKKELFEAFVFQIVATWDIFVEDLLVDCLNRDSSAYARYMGLNLKKHLSRSECLAMVVGLDYLDFRGISDLKKVARNILTPGNNPFRLIPKSAEKKIDELFAIRNYLAHHSIPAKRRLMTIYKERYKLKSFRTPGDFLYAARGKDGQIRFGDYVDAFSEASRAMGRALGLP
jgi:hypothetical protein